MTSTRKTLIASALLMSMVGIASAQSTMDNRSTSGNQYIGINGGPSDFSRANGGNFLFPNDSNNTAYGIAYGNYFANSNAGVEFGYTNYGQVSRGGGNTKAEGINISLIGRLPVGSMFNLTGKIGTTYGHTDVSANPASGLRTGSESGFDWSYGVGGELLISPQWSAVVNYDEAYMKFPGTDSKKIATTTIGARFHF